MKIVYEDLVLILTLPTVFEYALYRRQETSKRSSNFLIQYILVATPTVLPQIEQYYYPRGENGADYDAK